MRIFTSPAMLWLHLRKIHTPEVTLGLLPTMGALHEGHLALARRSVAENTATIASIFVNPLQFDNPDDLARYPRTLEADCAMLEAAGCEMVFAPSPAEMYAQSPGLKLDFGALEHVMEGAYRPGHFNGVGIVVSRLFHMIQPDRAYFGQKDYQQVAIVRQLITDLAFPIELVACPTVREADGLAMSSRNRRLSLDQRVAAPLIYQSLQAAKAQLLDGASVEAVKQFVRDQFAGSETLLLEYFEIADALTLQPLTDDPVNVPAVLCIAVHMGGVRLIDNVLV